MTRLDPNYIIEDTVTAEIDGQSFDFVVKATVFGEVLEVRNLFLELPEAAQRLAYGKNYADSTERLQAFAALIPYKVPVALSGVLKDEGLQAVVSAIKNRQAQIGLNWEITPSDYIEDVWTNEYYKYCASAEKQYKFPLELVHIIKSFLSDESDDGTLNNVLNTCHIKKRESNIPLLSSFVRHLAVLYDVEPARRGLYELLGLFPSEENKELLLSRFFNPSVRCTAADALNNLSNYKQDWDLYKAIIGSIDTTELRGSGFYHACLLSFLRKYPTPETNNLAWDALLNAKFPINKTAVVILRAFGVSDVEVMERIKPLLNNKQNLRLLELARVLKQINTTDISSPIIKEFFSLIEEACYYAPEKRIQEFVRILKNNLMEFTEEDLDIPEFLKEELKQI